MKLREHIRKVLKEETQIPVGLRRRLSLVPNYVKSAYNWLDPSRFNSLDEYIDRVVFSSTRDFVSDFSSSNYDEQLIIRDYIEPIIKKIIYDEFLDEIKKEYTKYQLTEESLESKWNVGDYDYQHGFCHYFAYNIINKIKKRFPKKKVNYYLLLASEVDKEDGTIVQEYLIHVYIKIDNMLLDSNGVTTIDKALARANEWEREQQHLVPDEYETKVWDEETNKIPDMFFNNGFCNPQRVKKDLEQFLSHPIVKRILRDK